MGNEIEKHLLESGLLSAKEFQSYSEELKEPCQELEGRCPLDASRLRSMDAVRAYGVGLYMLVRAKKPQVIVETGVQNGCSTEMILWALYRNKAGKLYSIDSGPTSTDGSHATRWNQTAEGIPGKDILRGLRSHWDLTIGFSRDKLPELCQHLQKIDIFWHDSDHSNDNVKFEFTTVKDYISAGGLLCLHDFNKQQIPLSPPEYQLIVPQREPFLRVWQKTQE